MQAGRKSPVPMEKIQVLDITGSETVLEKLQDLFTNCWEKGTLLQDLKDAVIVSLYKNKREKSDCSNYRGMTAFHCRQNLDTHFAE